MIYVFNFQDNSDKTSTELTKTKDMENILKVNELCIERHYRLYRWNQTQIDRVGPIIDTQKDTFLNSKQIDKKINKQIIRFIDRKSEEKMDK